MGIILIYSYLYELNICYEGFGEMGLCLKLLCCILINNYIGKICYPGVFYIKSTLFY